MPRRLAAAATHPHPSPITAILTALELHNWQEQQSIGRKRTFAHPAHPSHLIFISPRSARIGATLYQSRPLAVAEPALYHQLLTDGALEHQRRAIAGLPTFTRQPLTPQAHLRNRPPPAPLPTNLPTIHPPQAPPSQPALAPLARSAVIHNPHPTGSD